MRRLVLAVGANNGGVDRELLHYAVTDSEIFVRVMEEMGGLDPADVLLLRDPDIAAFQVVCTSYSAESRLLTVVAIVSKSCSTIRAMPMRWGYCWPVTTSIIHNCGVSWGLLALMCISHYLTSAPRVLLPASRAANASSLF